MIRWEPDAITRQPKGKVGDDCLIQGDFGTISRADFSLKLFRAFAYRIRKTFTRINFYWVGPEALKLWESGVRLTPDARVRPADLQRPPAINTEPAKLLEVKQPE